MFAVGVDVSNGRSMVAVLGARRSVVVQPHEVPHTADGFAELAARLHALDGEVRIVMEHTGRYYESFAMSMYRAGFFVSAVNPLAIKGYQEGISVRKVKTDKADALKIAQFAIDKWEILPHYTPMDTIRYDLKTLHRQFQLSSKTKTALNNNLIALLEQSSGCQKRSHHAAFSDILRTGDEDAKERSGAATSGRNVVHRYAGTQRTLAAEDRRSGEFRAHLRIGRRFLLRG